MDVIYNFPAPYTVDTVSVKAARDMSGPVVTVTPFGGDSRKSADVGHIGVAIAGKPTVFYSLKISPRTGRPSIKRIGPPSGDPADAIDDVIEPDDTPEDDADE